MATPPPKSLSSAISQAVVASSTSEPDPITKSAGWNTYQISGHTMPGVIAPDGIRGFSRATSWDTKKGKGQRGATITRTLIPLAKGSITSLLWTAAHFAAWDQIVRTVLMYYVSTSDAQTDAAQIVHPALAQNDVTSVVVEDIGVIRHLGKKLYSVTVAYLEWAPPPPKSIVVTPTKATTAAPILGTDDPDTAAASAIYYESSAKHAAAVGQPGNGQ
jgi:hypothetical protein